MSTYLIDSIEGLFDSCRLGHMSAIAEWPKDKTTMSRTPYFELRIMRIEGEPNADFDSIGKLLYEQMILIRKVSPPKALLYWRTGDRISCSIQRDLCTNLPVYQTSTRIAIPGLKIRDVQILEGVWLSQT